MADWTELDTNGLLPGEPLTSAKALAFFENPVAITEGATGAPRNTLKSIERIAAGASLRATMAETYGGSETRTVLGLIIAQIGTVRVAVTTSITSTRTITRRRGGVSTTLLTGGGTGAITSDVSVIPGDLISCIGAVGASSTTITATFSTNGENLWPAGGTGGALVNNDV